MRKKQAPPKTLRINDKIWQKFKSHKLKSGKSWDSFISEINEKLK